jgi:hypothetical protein
MAIITRGNPNNPENPNEPYIEGTCKATKVKVRGQKKPRIVIRDGREGTGVTLPFTCGFCRDFRGRPTVAFRSRKQRNQHTNFCTE